jgi:DNA-binding SARP family transcriptional activator
VLLLYECQSHQNHQPVIPSHTPRYVSAMLCLKTLGSPVVEGSAGPLSGAAAQRKPLALLALLAVERERGLSRDKIVAYLWPEAEPDKAAHRLNQLLYALRRDLRSDALFLGSSDLRLNPTVLGTDVSEFAVALDRCELERAVDVYRGPFLDGFYLNGALEFERWVEEERADLARRYRGALDELASEAARRGDWANSVEWWRRLAQSAPLDARVALSLMEALNRAGDRAGALQVAKVHEALLREELAAPVDPAVASLAEQIRRIAEAHDSVPGYSNNPEPQTPSTSVAARVEAVAVGAPAIVLRRRAKLASWPWIVPAAGAGLAVLAGGALIASSLRKPAFEPKRVVVGRFENRTGNASLDPLGSIAADWITRGLSETHLVDVVDASAAMAVGSRSSGSPNLSGAEVSARKLALQTAAGTVVVGSFYGQGDSLYFEAKVVGAAGDGVLAALPPIGAPASLPLAAIDALRRRVMVALAFRFDPRLRDFPSTSEPPTYEAYRRYVEGLSLHMRGDFHGAIREFTLAAASDSEFRAPLLLAAVGRFWLREYPAADSLARLVSRSRDRLTPMEGYTLKWLQAQLAGDRMKALQISREVGRLAPGTVTELQLAVDALGVNRPHEALGVLRTIDPDRGLLRESGFPYWWALTTAYHVLGDHGRELRAAARARKQYAGTWDALFLEMRALAALGRVPALKARLDEGTGLAPGAFWSPELALVLVGKELRAHGQQDAARDVFARAVAWQRAGPPLAAPGGRGPLIYALYLAGDWEAAQGVAAELAAEDSSDWYSRAFLARLAARRSDQAQAERISQTLASIDQPYLFGSLTLARASIAALLGKRADAVALLRQALAEGFPYVHELHIDADLEALRGYPPFEELLRPKGED